jgi:predicted dehydrogenase
MDRIIPFALIGGGLMGREFASAAARWCHLLDLDFAPSIVAVCSGHESSLDWFRQHVPGLKLATTDYRRVLDMPEVEAVYCAVPHQLHAPLYTDILRAGKHLLGEKPFGIDQAANAEILRVAAEHPNLLARCASQFAFYPGAYRITQWLREEKFGQIFSVAADFLHSSDLNPLKPINWKRQAVTNGEYGVLGDLGLHALYIPLRFGLHPANVRALLTKIIPTRPGPDGNPATCDTWDNATLACEITSYESRITNHVLPFPLLVKTNRISPGHANTWRIHIEGTALSAAYSTQHTKLLRSLPYTPGGPQEWHTAEMPYQSAYPAISGGIFEFGFSDALLQLWAAFCDELVHGREGMRQPLYCLTPEETALGHQLFTAALASQRSGQTIHLKG